MFTITCLVNDETQPGSGLRAEHGLSFFIQADDKRLLFDTGSSGQALLHNASILGVELRRVTALVISHSHPDHTGGMQAFLSLVPGCKVFAHPAIFQERFARRPEAGGRSARHVIRTPHGWAPDPYADDMALVLDTSRGLVVVLGCGHAGLLNILAHVRRTFDRQVKAILGGAHLLDLSKEEVDHIISILKEEYGSPGLYLNHCTGDRALRALRRAFPDRAVPCPAGPEVAF